MLYVYQLRVSKVLDDKSDAVAFSNALNVGGITTMQVQNTTIGPIPDGYSIQLREFIVDPRNYRFRDGRWFASTVASNNGLISSVGTCGL